MELEGELLNLAISVPWVPPAYIGGGETHIYYLTKELAKLGVNINLFTANLPEKADEWNWEHLRLRECSYLFNVGNTPVMPFLLQKMLRCRRCDLIHTAVPSGFACDVSALVSTIRRLPLVITHHCDLATSSGMSSIYGLFLKLYTFRRADKIIAATRSYAETSPLLRSFMTKVEIVPYGADLAKYSFNEQKSAEIKGKHNIGKDEKVILFVGGLNYYHRFKRVDLLINAMANVVKKHRNVSLIVVGEGDLKGGLQDLCQQLDLAKVVFTGYVSNEDLPKYYSAADLFVLPSLTREEAFGIVLVEAAASGAVPICFDIPGPNEVCRTLGGFVVPTSPGETPQESLSEIISSALATDLESQSKICAESAKKYSWTNIAQETLKVYEAAMRR